MCSSHFTATIRSTRLGRTELYFLNAFISAPVASYPQNQEIYLIRAAGCCRKNVGRPGNCTTPVSVNTWVFILKCLNQIPLELRYHRLLYRTDTRESDQWPERCAPHCCLNYVLLMHCYDHSNIKCLNLNQIYLTAVNTSLLYHGQWPLQLAQPKCESRRYLVR